MNFISLIFLEGSLLDVNPGTIFWTFVTFLILLFVLSKTAWSPIIKGLTDRENKIQKAITDANEAAKQALLSKEKSESIIKEAHAEAIKIVKEATERAERQRVSLEEKTKKEISQMLENAKKEIEMSKEKAMSELRENVTEMIIKGSEMILKAELELSDSKQDDLLNRLLSKE